MDSVTFSSLNNSGNLLPVVIQPSTSAKAGVSFLKEWITNHQPELEDKITKSGAVLFRNFDIVDAADFETIAKVIDPELKNDYLGTSPRNSKTEFVFSASELPDFYPIAQHCEMSFLDTPPRKLFFFCQTAPEKDGETPICDFRKVYNDMDKTIRDEIMQKGIRYVRNYDGPDTPKGIDMFKLKRWDEMFHTTDPKKVEEICAKNKLGLRWKDKGRLVLENEKDGSIKHPKTGENVWFNHLQVFHIDAPAIEYSKIAKRQKYVRTFAVNVFLHFLTAVKKLTIKPEDQAVDCYFRDGTPIPKSYIEHIEEVIWKNLVFFQWQKGDVIAIDNFSTSHGRMPYKGQRDILVCWSA